MSNSGFSISCEKTPITPNVNEWSSELDTSLPIQGADIPGFKSWVNCNGFLLNHANKTGHDGFDFAAYLREDGIIILGLPEDTPVRAVANGEVYQVNADPEWTGGGYGAWINVQHASDDSGMQSGYVHVVPSVEEGAHVEKGEIIGTLYKDDGEQEGRLVHLHMSLIDGWGTHGTSITGGGVNLRRQDPGLIESSIYENTVSEQGFAPFDYTEVPGAKGIQIAHFQRMRVNQYVWQS